MSDEFDDLAWMDDDEPGDDDEQQEEESFDWQKPPDQSGTPPGGHLGFTGELPWIGEPDDESEAADDAGEFVWSRPAGDEEDATSDEFDVDWLRTPASSEEDAADEPADSDDDIPDWLREDSTTPEEAEPEQPATDLPEWLRGADVTMTDDTGALSSEWLASGSELPDTADSEKTFDQWMLEQTERERVPDLEEQMPDLSDLGETGDEADADTGALPDWFLGMEELDVEDAPDWFSSDHPPTADLDDSPITDWLAAQTPEPEPEEAPAAPETPREDMLSGDFFASMDDDAETETPQFDEDFFASMGTETDESLDDVFASLGEGEPGSAETPSMLDDDFFASMGGETETDDTADEDDYYDTADEPAEAADAVGDDFLTSLGIEFEEDTPEGYMPEAESSVDIDDLDTLFGTDEPEDFNVESVPDGQLLQSLGIEDSSDEDEQFDWFALDEQDAEDAADLEAANWLDDLGDLDESALAAEEPPEPEAEPPQFAAELDDVDAPGLGDIDTLLASMGGDMVTLPDTGNLLDEDTDFDSLFSDPAFSDIDIVDIEAVEDDDLPQAPDWLTEAGATVGGLSAAAILRQRDDRPLDDLPDRLKRLRDRGTAVTARASDPDSLEGFALDTSEINQIAAPLVAGTGAAVVLSPDQQGRVELLKNLTATESVASIAAARAVSDEPFLLDENEVLVEASHDAEWTEPRQRTRYKVDRLLIALVLAAAIIVPFVSDFRLGDPPPAMFAGDSRQQVVFDSLDRLNPGDHVLVGMEYGPTAAPELDSTARVLLQHILTRRAIPVIVSTNPVALLRADNLLNELGGARSPLLETLERDTPLRPNEDYFVIRYLTGGAVGLRSLGETPGVPLATDINGQPTGLTATDDFAQVIVIAERPDDLRAWAEQVAPLTNAPLLAATGYSGEPLIEPYVGSTFDGLLVGFKDTYTYGSMLSGMGAPPLAPTEETPTPIMTEPPLVEVTEEATAEATIEATQFVEAPETGLVIGIQNINVRSGPGPSQPIVGSVAPGQTVDILQRSPGWVNIRLADGTEGWIAEDLVQADRAEATATATPRPTNTPVVPTNTPAPSATPLITNTSAPTSPAAAPATATTRPSATPQPSPTPVPSATPQTEIVAQVIADTTINVRSGPNTSFPPVGTADPGDTFAVIGRNSDGSWIQVDYPDLTAGQEAWIAAFLLDVTAQEIPPEASSGRIIIAMAGSDYSRLLVQADTPTPETADEAPTAEATENMAEADTPAEDDAMLPAGESVIPMAEARWSAMNLGLVAIIVIILFGTLINIGRALLRRGK
ncbi:MAG: hypothetical protein CL610_12305 [Anaerolineaceae bacterium]|nr:hypothetical protein [Anaerolineaceae bacterium]